MQHGLMYQGAFESNFASLRPGIAVYRATDGAEHPLPPWPDHVDGVRIGFMERAGKKFFAVRVQFEEHDVVLENPVALDPMRHLNNRRLTAQPTILDDQLASTLLDDIIERNQAQATDLALLINRVNQVRRGDRSE